MMAFDLAGSRTKTVFLSIAIFADNDHAFSCCVFLDFRTQPHVRFPPISVINLASSMCPLSGRRPGRSERPLDDSELPSPLRRPNDPPVVASLVRVGDGHFVARHRIGGLY
jgi:hypothetical protein